MYNEGGSLLLSIARADSFFLLRVPVITSYVCLLLISDSYIWFSQNKKKKRMSKQDAKSQQVKLQVSSLRVPNVKTVHPAMVRRAISWQKSGMGAATIMPRETIIVAGAGEIVTMQLLNFSVMW